MTAAGPLVCTMRLPDPGCGQPATEILLTREAGSDQWLAFGRCAGHPAADSAALIDRCMPLTAWRIVPVPPAGP